MALHGADGRPLSVPPMVVCLGATTAAHARVGPAQRARGGRSLERRSGGHARRPALGVGPAPRRLVGCPGDGTQRRTWRRARPGRPASRSNVSGASGGRRHCAGWWPRSRLTVDDLNSHLLFVREGIDAHLSCRSRPCRARTSTPVDSRPMSDRSEAVGLAWGSAGLILFHGVPRPPGCATGSGAWDPDGIAQVALRALRQAVGDDLVLMADLCLDEYTDHGHCGVLGPTGEVLNDATLELYQRVAVAQAEAGADVVAPSGMLMDGQVAAIRARPRLFRARPGGDPRLFGKVRLRASTGPSATPPSPCALPVAGTRLPAYQQDPHNRRESMQEIRAGPGGGRRHDHGEAGHDVPRCADGGPPPRVPVPLAAYHVSGEYSMVQAAAAPGDGLTGRRWPWSS